MSNRAARPGRSFNRKQWGMPPSGPRLNDGPDDVITHGSGGLAS